MKKIKYIAAVISLLMFSFKSKAQIENMIVETYYVSDSLDATDTIGGILPVGSTTYRIYIDLAPGCKLKKIFGDAKHTMRISSTDVFWNNLNRGRVLGYQFSTGWLKEGTVALDTYLTMGQTTKNSTVTYFGVLKAQDPDTSIIGGVNNDGGWDSIPDGLISNQAAAAGIPVTLKDGMTAMSSLTPNPILSGDLDLASGAADSTIFGSKVTSEFISDSAGFENTPVPGVIPDSNQILVAQLTTKGTISFELNVVVEQPAQPIPIDVTYVAHLDSADVPSNTFQMSPFLSYPFSCGCRDPHFLEYKSTYACDDSSQCKTQIIFGCMDPSACNYDPSVNFNIPDLCCYPGYCNNRNLTSVCPVLNNERMRAEASSLYPDPAEKEITLQIPAGEKTEMHYAIYDCYGKEVLKKAAGEISFSAEQKIIYIASLTQGLYILRLYMGAVSETKKFIKD